MTSARAFQSDPGLGTIYRWQIQHFATDNSNEKAKQCIEA